jgi:DNA-binding beta-propeller fold protein YncE
MSPLLAALSRYVRLPQRGHCRKEPARARTGRTRRRTPLSVEALEERSLLSVTISVANANLNEIGSPSAFIAAGSGGLSSPNDITLGPDGNVYVASAGNNSVIRYTPSGQLLGTFVSQGSGGLGFTRGAELAFGPDANLYITSGATNQVLEYNGSTGAFLQAFVSAGSGGLVNPCGLRFGPDGNLYVSSWDQSSGLNGIMRFQGPSGASPGSPLPSAGESWAAAAFTPIFAPQATDGGGARQPLFGPDGNLYVDGGDNQGINRYDGTTGAFLGVFVSQGTGTLMNGRGMAFDPEGRLYVADSGDSVHRYDAQGNSLGDLLVNSVNPSLAKPAGITFDAQGRLLIDSTSSNSVVRYDRGVMVTLSAASATPVSVNYTTVDGTATAGKDYDGQSGTVTFAPGQTSREILLATQEDAVLDGNETFSVQLSSPTGGSTIANGTATVTIVDPTRSFAVADTSAIEADHTAHYRGAFVQGVPSNSGGGFYCPIAFGPDGNLYTSEFGLSGLPVDAIGRFNGTTGAFMGAFTSGQNGQTRHIAFHNGYLYVATEVSNDVVRYDATTGTFVDVFVPPGSGGISAPYGLAFGPDGNLYVAGRSSNNVVKYDGSTGAYLGTFVASASGGLNLPQGMAFDPSGTYLYVASTGSGQVLKYNASTGAYVGVAASAGVSGPTDVTFGSDGLLYVLSSGNDRILRYTESGTYVDDYVPSSSLGTANLSGMAFGPDGDLYVAAWNPSQVMRFGTENEALFTVTSTTASTLALTVNYATADGTAVAGTNYTATSGTFTFAPGVTSDSGSQTAPLTFTLNLSNPEAATLSRSQATGTTQPSDQAARFYVVNDATPTIGGTNTAYKYQPSGTAQAPYGLSLSDLDPRGVASNAAGTTQWVVDANKNVYVYSPGGTLLGSWSAGGLSSTAALTGIATNGTDIWLVDSYTDKVYKYAGAASRLSGSQNPASSFSLAGGRNGDPNPQDMVTDGTSFWVVDGTKLKVFKYTLSGSLLGSWSIDPADTHPTGITINPNNVSDVWIVDSGTLKVYDYTGAGGRTSGSQNAAATFALAAGDTNPQGIADPPPADLPLTPAAAPLALNQPGEMAFPAAASGSVSVVAGVPSLADRDAVFARLGRDSLLKPGAPSNTLPAGEALPSWLDRPTLVADRVGTPTPVSGEQQPADLAPPLAPENSPGFRLDRSAAGLPDDSSADEETPVSAAAMDSFFAGLADGALAEA